MESKKLTFRHYLMIGSFDLWDVIWSRKPDLSSSFRPNGWEPLAKCSFRLLASGVLLPVLGLLAISITQSRGIYELARPVGHSYALLFMILIYATIGPFFCNT